MSKRRNGAQLDLDLSGSTPRNSTNSNSSSGQIMHFVDSATLQIRRDALRRVTANGIFKIPTSSNRD